MYKEKKLSMLCIRCPKGCELTVFERDKQIRVEGNECRIGVEYAIEETKDPRRIVSSTVEILNSKYPRLPVRTRDTIPKDKIKKVVEDIKGKIVKAPVKKGEIISKNVAGTGVDLIAERDMECVKT